ncbi:PadR family transcriptional regulator [Clostridium oryzae]|uniref:Lineage-specific thermal regulator protein n=1 Tax=Clostridium oryzae TaxID=1450648 RepID=A0A1V4ILY0_9CLOT|nr:lineage-specific thermal regulator protein [Clostridium oryzae]
MEKLKSYGFTDISEGTIYQLLVRLEKKKIISSKFRPSPLGPNQKYYSITADGLDMLHSFEDYWNSISETVNKILDLGVEK